MTDFSTPMVLGRYVLIEEKDWEKMKVGKVEPGNKINDKLFKVMLELEKRIEKLEGKTKAQAQQIRVIKKHFNALVDMISKNFPIP